MATFIRTFDDLDHPTDPALRVDAVAEVRIVNVGGGDWTVEVDVIAGKVWMPGDDAEPTGVLDAAEFAALSAELNADAELLRILADRAVEVEAGNAAEAAFDRAEAGNDLPW